MLSAFAGNTAVKMLIKAVIMCSISLFGHIIEYLKVAYGNINDLKVLISAR